MVGLRQEGTSDGFIVDATAPMLGRIIIISPSSTRFDIKQIMVRYGNLCCFKNCVIVGETFEMSKCTNILSLL